MAADTATDSALGDWKRYVKALVPSALLLLGVVVGVRAFLDQPATA